MCSDDGLLECLAGLDDDEPRKRQLGDGARRRISPPPTPPRGASSSAPPRARTSPVPTANDDDDVADLREPKPATVVARAARDQRRGRRRAAWPSTDVPDYDDDLAIVTANDEADGVLPRRTSGRVTMGR